MNSMASALKEFKANKPHDQTPMRYLFRKYFAEESRTLKRTVSADGTENGPRVNLIYDVLLHLFNPTNPDPLPGSGGKTHQNPENRPSVRAKTHTRRPICT